jgi:hypothetical protein
MISSWRGVAIAGAVAALLAIALVVDLGRTPARVDRALVPGFAPDRVTALVWERAGQPAVEVARTGGAWQIRARSSAPADSGAISDVLAALRGARWHRRSAPTPVHATLTVVSGAARHAIGLGDVIAGTDQSWIVADGRGVVVDSWVARALDRDVLALRIRSPLADVRRARTIVLESAGTEPDGSPARVDLRIEGRPRRSVRPVALLLAAEPIDELERALGELAIVQLPAAPAQVRGLAISIAGAEPSASSMVTVEIGGSCPGSPQLVAVSGTAGDGCIEQLAATAIERAIARLRQPPDALVERRPIPFELQRIALADGTALELSPLRVGDHPADQARVAELLAALAAPAEVVPLPARPAAQHLVVTDRLGATTTVDLFAERVLARHGEPVALRPPPGAWSLLVRPSRELRDATLWLEEPTTITALRIDDILYQRGAVIGEWSRRPSAATRTATIEALVATLAAPHALGFIDERVATAHRVMITVTPPVGPVTERTVEVGPARAAGCPVRVERDAFLLPVVVCAQVAELAR